jgi:hypothetical protein
LLRNESYNSHCGAVSCRADGLRNVKIGLVFCRILCYNSNEMVLFSLKNCFLRILS